MNEYMNVKTAVTMTYGAIWPKRSKITENGATACNRCAKGLCSAVPKSPIATASRMGPKIMTLKYSAKRRPKLRGRPTRHTELKLVSTF